MGAIHKFLVVIFTLCIISSLFTSCIYYQDSYPSTYGTNGYDGKAYVRLNWKSIEPDYIETNGLVPNNFYWNTDYRTYPGYYTVHYEYDYNNGYKIVTYAYDADIQVWVNKGESGGVRYNGRNGADSYFDMIIYPDGGYDFDVTSLKSGKSDSLLLNKPIGIIDSSIFNQNGISMKVIYKRVIPRSKRIQIK